MFYGRLKWAARFSVVMGAVHVLSDHKAALGFILMLWKHESLSQKKKNAHSLYSQPGL